MIPPFPNAAARRIVEAALAEDVGSGDLTTNATVPADARAQGRFVTRQPGVICGVPAAALVFQQLDPSLIFEALAPEGAAVGPGTAVASVRGPARPILTGERTALNLLQHLSGIATATAAAAARIAGTGTRMLDTRKTTPGLRALEKYAVAVGGGMNHRMGLYDGVLIKNNHLKFTTITEAVARARETLPAGTFVEVEADTLDQVWEAVDAGVDRILLDNMPTALIRSAVDLVSGRVALEVSGGVTPARIPELAAAGVDFISMGALTHSAQALDIHLEVEPFPADPGGQG